MRADVREIRERLVRVGARLAFRCVMAGVVLALLATLLPRAGGVRQVMAGTKTAQVICPGPILKGSSAHMRLRLKDHHTICAGILTYNGSFTASGYDGVWTVGTENSDSLYVPVVAHEAMGTNEGKRVSTSTLG